MGAVTDELSGYPGAPPGWYPDPAGGPGQRWWDGYAWTETVVLPTPPPPPPSPTPHQLVPAYTPYAPAPDPRSSGALFQRELAISRLARAAMAMFALYYLVNLIIQQTNRAQYRIFGHEFHLIYVAAQNGQPAPSFSQNGSIDPLSPIIGLLTVLAVVAACMWQHRAAMTARALGLPFTHSPGWGVGSWFVPIVNLWMPYQAIRDCLPPDDPNRTLILRWWLLLTATWIMWWAAVVTALFSESAGTIISVPAALLALGLLATAPRVVSRVTSAHHTLIGRPIS
jgi:Domain of unknown function (DUF4328)/Protein of unknown function (DUF2510)